MGICIQSGKDNDIGEYDLFHICAHMNIHKERNYGQVKLVQDWSKTLLSSGEILGDLPKERLTFC